MLINIYRTLYKTTAYYIHWHSLESNVFCKNDEIQLKISNKKTSRKNLNIHTSKFSMGQGRIKKHVMLKYYKYILYKIHIMKWHCENQNENHQNSLLHKNNKRTGKIVRIKLFRSLEINQKLSVFQGVFIQEK